MRVLTYRGGQAAKQPILYDMGDGRSWEFPGDLPSAAFVEFLDNHAEGVTQGVWSYVALRDFLRLIASQNPAVLTQTAISELGTVASDLFNAYIYGTPTGDDDAAAEVAADTVPSTA